MKSSKKSADTSSPPRAEVHLAAEGGAPYSPCDDRDPYEILDELMTVVEALSPRWPKRDKRIAGDCFRL